MLKKKISNLFLIITSLCLAFLFVELILKYFYPQNLSGSWRVMHESGLILNKNNGQSKHEWNGGKLKAKYLFGQYHNRIYKDLPIPISNKKILILGDSFTFGWLLNDEDTFVYQLQKKFGNRFFINVAAGGWGTADHLKYIELYCNKINPEQVWIFLNNSDIDRAIHSNLYVIDERNKLSKVKPQENIVTKIKFTINYFLLYQWLLENLHTVQLIRNFFLETTVYNATFKNSNNFTNDQKYLLLQKKLFIEIKKEVNVCNANLKIFYIGWPHYDNKNKTESFIKLVEKEMFFFKNNIEFYNLKYTKYMIDVNKNPKYYELGETHPNQYGNNKIFFAINKYLSFDPY